MAFESVTSNITNWATIAVALLAVGVTVWQGWVARKHNRISVTPMIVHHVDTDIRNDGIKMSFVIKNVGIGTALVIDRYFLLRGERFDSRNPNNLIKELCESMIGNAFNYQIISSGIFGNSAKIPAGAQMTLATLFFPGLDSDTKESVEALMNAADFVVEYKSIYGEVFKYRFND